MYQYNGRRQVYQSDHCEGFDSGSILCALLGKHSHGDVFLPSLFCQPFERLAVFEVEDARGLEVVQMSILGRYEREWCVLAYETL